MKFKGGTAIIVGPQEKMLGITNDVSFDTIWQICSSSFAGIVTIVLCEKKRRKTPTESQENFLDAWVAALHPFPFSLTLISPSVIEDDYHTFFEDEYIASIESKNSWIHRGRRTPREYTYNVHEKGTYYFENHDIALWRKVAVERNYEI